MQTMLIKERYKVVRALEVQEEYAFLETVDIKDRDKSTCFLNVYEGSILPTYLDVFDRLENCSEYVGTAIADGSLIAVFRYCSGETIDELFYRGAEIGWKDRLEFAELVLHKALSMSNYPPEISCAAMLSENLILDLPDQSIKIRWKVPPMEGMNSRELVYLTVDQLKKILLRNFATPLEEREFIQKLDDGQCLTVVRLYSLWRESRPQIEAAYAAMEKKNIFSRWFSNLWKNIKWKWKQRKKR